MELKSMTFEEAFSLYDENPGDITVRPIEKPEDVFASDEDEKRD